MRSRMARAVRLLAKGAAATRRQVQMEMVAVRFVGLRSQHGAEDAAGALVQSAKEGSLGTGLRLFPRLSHCRRRADVALALAAAQAVELRAGIRAVATITEGPRNGTRGTHRCLLLRLALALLAFLGACGRWLGGFPLIAPRRPPVAANLNAASVGGNEGGNVDGVRQRMFTQTLAMACAAVAIAAGVARGVGQACDRTAESFLGRRLQNFADPFVQTHDHGAVEHGGWIDLHPLTADATQHHRCRRPALILLEGLRQFDFGRDWR